jgi:sodium-dependent dicarboxylate transporter 2/3/5
MIDFERLRAPLGFTLAPLLAIVILLLPMPGLSIEAHRLAAIAAAVIVLWISQAIPLPVTALLGPVLAIAAGVAPSASVLASFGDPVIFLFLGSFLLARAMEIHGVDRRLASSLLAHRWVGASTVRTLWAMGLAAGFLSMWISNTACVAMLFPVVMAIARTTEEQLGHRAPHIVTAFLLMLAYSASVAGMATPVGTPPNLIGFALIEKNTGIRIGFLQWMLVGVPLSLALFGVLFVILRVLHPPEARIIPGLSETMRQVAKSRGPLTAGERNALLCFGIAIALWIGPGILAAFLGSANPVSKLLAQRLPEGAAAILAASLLFILPVSWKERRFTLEWKDALRIDWGTILLFGGGIALGRMSFETGLAESIGRGLSAFLGVSNDAALAATSVATGVLVSELSSNTASANMVVPVMISMAQAIGARPEAIGVAATLGSSLGFALPISTPPNAIVYGSERIKLNDMIRAGVLLDAAGAILVWAAAVWLVPFVL